jgi:hypothetical protein
MSYTAEAFYGDYADTPALLRSGQDVERMISEMLVSGWDDSVAALYLKERPLNPAGVPDHELLVAVNHEDKVGGLQYFGPDQGHAATSLGSEPRDEELSYQYMGNERIFPAASEIPLVDVIAAVKEFLQTGVRPACVQWQPYILEM